MKKIFIFGVLVLFLISFVVAENNDTNETCTENWDCTNWSTCINNEQTRTCIDLNDCGTTEDKPEESQTCVIEETDQEKCENVGGIWKLFGDGCVDSCELARQDPNNPIACTEAETMGCDCGSDKCWDGETCVLNEEEDEEASNKVCCHKFGYGNQMKKVNSQYQWIDEESCVTPEGFVGGGREVVDDEYCENQTKKIHRIKPSLPIDECPEGCTCTGSTVKCPINDGGRIMTVYAGKSGNVIVQIKNVNMSTNVTLYKANKTLYGVFRNNQTKEIKVFPDEVKEKIRQ
ncbi:hypothetical protein KAT80_02550, partial [Candidatus Pacearchaeota archaeon]|nr:hypothetical protein [Candidatus Pacearchaeota archaeon]